MPDTIAHRVDIGLKFRFSWAATDSIFWPLIERDRGRIDSGPFLAVVATPRLYSKQRQ